MTVPVFFPQQYSGSIMADWVEFLRRAQELPIGNDVSSATTLRFFHLPSYSYPSVTVVSRTPDGWTCRCKVLDGLRYADELVWQSECLLGRDDGEAFSDLLQSTDFWRLPTRIARGGLDGEFWLLELVDGGKYHVIERWMPEEPPLVALGAFLQRVSPLASYRRDPRLVEARQRLAQEIKDAQGRAAEDRAERIARLNPLARTVARRQRSEGMTCPRCQTPSRDFRFVDKGTSTTEESFFVCKACGCSFAADEIRVDTPAPHITLDMDSGYGRRIGGCLLGFLLFSICLTAGDYLARVLPTLALQVGAIVMGLGLIQLFRRVAARRWSVATPDPVQILASDFTSIRRRDLADIRLRFPPDTPFVERALHESLYVLKWCAHLLIFAGLGSLLYAAMRHFGLAS